MSDLGHAADIADAGLAHAERALHDIAADPSPRESANTAESGPTPPGSGSADQS